jgi:hypothetical protein
MIPTLKRLSVLFGTSIAGLLRSGLVRQVWLGKFRWGKVRFGEVRQVRWGEVW